MQLTVRIAGLDSIKRKLDGSWLVQPETERALDTIEARVERQGSGLGARRNTIRTINRIQEREVISTLNWPRTTGSSRTKKNIGIFRRMAPNVIRALFRRIAARWSS